MQILKINNKTLLFKWDNHKFVIKKVEDNLWEFNKTLLSNTFIINKYGKNKLELLQWYFKNYCNKKEEKINKYWGKI